MTDQMEPGIYKMSDEEYFSHPAYSNSDLKLISRSPAHFWAAKRDPNRVIKEDTDALRKGKALHCAVLEPESFNEKYIKAPADAPKRPTQPQIDAKKPTAMAIERIEYWTDFDDRAGDRVIFDAVEYDNYMKIAETMHKDPELAVLLSNGLAEHCVFATDPETGLMVKCKTDYFRTLANGLHVITDLKTTVDARPHPFQRDAYKYGYFQQAGFYSDVWQWAGIEGINQIDVWMVLAFEKDAPNAYKLYEVGGDDIEFGRKQHRAALNIAAECHATDTWPGYNSDVESLHIPGYAKVE